MILPGIDEDELEIHAGLITTQQTKSDYRLGKSDDQDHLEIKGPASD